MLAKILLLNKNKLPDVNEKFFPIAKFENDADTLQWSFVVECKKILTDDTIEADVYFLMENAPFDCLVKNNTFQLYEGKKLIGEGVLL